MLTLKAFPFTLKKALIQHFSRINTYEMNTSCYDFFFSFWAIQSYLFWKTETKEIIGFFSWSIGYKSKLSSVNQKTQSTVNTEIEHNLKKDAVELHTSDLFYARCQYQQRIVEYWDLNHWKLSYWVKSVHFVSVDSRKVLNQHFPQRKRKGL